jgi:uncharacterized membrane protein YqiK
VNKSVRGRIKEKLKEHNKEIGKWEEEEGRREAEEDRREAEQVYENTKTVQEKLTQRKKRQRKSAKILYFFSKREGVECFLRKI